MNIVSLSSGHPLRPLAFRLIQETYLDYYDACVARLPKTIVALIDEANRVHCAAGLRDFSEPYFSEFYLDAPIEELIGRLSGQQVKRCEIVEVSSLASRTPASSVCFLRDLIIYGEELGYNWAFFTATSRLEKLLRRIGLPLIYLGTASSSQVPSPEAWGSYYQTCPKVFAIGRAQVAAFLAKNTGQSVHG